jgi:hypothetical protein
MRRLSSVLVVMAVAGPVFAMQQGSPPMPRVSAPGGWPLVGYLVAGLMFAAAIALSLLASNRSDPDSGALS